MATLYLNAKKITQNGNEVLNAMTGKEGNAENHDYIIQLVSGTYKFKIEN